jgi:6-pyruvoyl-tetrahydropterin synthase
LNPSAENIAKYIYDEVHSGLKTKADVRLGSVRLWETDTAYAVYRPGTV